MKTYIIGGDIMIVTMVIMALSTCLFIGSVVNIINCRKAEQAIVDQTMRHKLNIDRWSKI